MRIDLRSDSKRVRKYIERRAKEFLQYVNQGPGKDEDDIRLITLGFGFDQAGWIALVFDTRPKAEFDGQWQSYIEENAEPFESWFKAFDDMQESGTSLSIVQTNGKRTSFDSDSDMEEIADCIGSMCRDALQQSREVGAFQKLPLADECRLAVEEHEGNFGWIEGSEEDDQDPDEILDQLRSAARRLSKGKQIAHWIEQLDQLAAGKPCAAAKLIGGDELALEELLKIGADAIVPLLNWANTWADKPEFKPPHKVRKGEDCEYPNASVLYEVFAALQTCAAVPPKAEFLIQRYIRTALQVAPISEPQRGKRRPLLIYGVVPYHAARVLHSRYEGYPEPIKDDSTNQLQEPEQFIGKAKPKRK